MKYTPLTNSPLNRKEMEEIYIVLHKGSVWGKQFFPTRELARNAIKWYYPKSKFKEERPDVLINCYSQAKFEVMKLEIFNS